MQCLKNYSWAMMILASFTASANLTSFYEFPEPVIHARQLDMRGAKGVMEFEMVDLPGAPLAAQPGRPLIPHRPVTLLIPQDEQVVSIGVFVDSWHRIPGFHTLFPAQHESPLSHVDLLEPTGPDPEIYSSQGEYPGVRHSTPKIFWSKGYQIFTVNLFPVRYYPESGILEYAEQMQLTVHTAPGMKSTDIMPCRALNSDRDWLIRKIENQELAASYRSELSSDHNSRDEYQYVIITSQAIASMAGPNNFQDLLALKQMRGISGTIKTIESISSEYPGIDLQTKIRNFCIFAYENWNTEYILLGADHGVLPTRGCYATAEGEEDSSIPTDMYYGCLDGTWDESGNGIYGEINDGPGGSDPDVFAELFIGRASIDSSTQLHNFVSKTIAYETDNYSAEWADNALLLGEYLWPATYGDYYMNELWYGSDANGYSTPGYPPEWDIDHLYESEGSWGSAQLIPKLNSNNLFWVNHLGHASESSVMNLYTSNVESLTNSRPFLVYSQGCYAGAFDTTDCIAEYFSWAAHGAFSVLMNGRYGWGEIGNTDGSSQYFHRQFHDAYFTEQIREIGRMNQDSKEDNVWCLDYKSNRWVCYEMNLLGCPQTPINGLNTTRGSLVFDKIGYGSDDILTAVVRDIDLNLDPLSVDQTQVTITVEGNLDSETLTLYETAESSCVFQASIPVRSQAYSSGNDMIDVTESDLIEGLYLDATDGFGGTNIPVTAQATADFSTPIISSVSIEYLDDHSAMVEWTTSEPADSRVVYDTISPPTANEALVHELTTTHQVTLTGLDQCLDYYFYVESHDAAGNGAVDDNAGGFYTFSSMIRLYVLNEPMNTNPGWTISGGDWQFGHPTGQPSGPGHDPSSGFDGPNVYGTNLTGAYSSGTYHLTTPPLNCSDAFNTKLSFYRWLAVDGSDNGDNASVSISTDGSTWTVLYENCPSNFYEYRWTRVSYDISEIADGQSQVFIRWTMGPGGSGSAGGWNIDNVELSYPAPCNVPILLHQSHTVDDSAGNNDGYINPDEPISSSVTLKNVGLDATNITGVLTTGYPHIDITNPTVSFGDIQQGGSGSSVSNYEFMVTESAQDGDMIQFNIEWTCDQTTGQTSFSESVRAARLGYDSHSILDSSAKGDGDGILDPGETADLAVMLKNTGHLAATGLTGVLSVDHPEYLTIDSGSSSWPDIDPEEVAANFSPYFTISANPATPDHTIVELTLTIDGDSYSAVLTFDLEITTSTFTRRYYFPLDTSPGWTVEGDWQFGQPLGSGGDPSSAYTGTNVYGYNLAGQYPNNLPVRSLTTTPLNCSIFSSVEVHFMRWLGIESSSYDHASFDVSVNGSTWTTIWSHSGSSFTDTEWVPQIMDISGIADGESQVRLRWTMGPTDGSVTYCGWNIDDIEVWAEADEPQPVLEHQSHEIEDSGGIEDGHLNPGETVSLYVTAHNYGLSGSNITGYISSSSPDISFPVNEAQFPDIPANGNGQTLTPFVVTIGQDIEDATIIPLTVTWISDEGNGSFNFSEEIYGPDIVFTSSVIIDSSGDGDGILDPGETGQISLLLSNHGRMNIQNISGLLASNQPGHVTIIDDSSDFEDAPAGEDSSSIDPHFTVSISPSTPENTLVVFTLDLTAPGYQTSVDFQAIVTTSTFTKRYSWTLDTNPNWTCEGDWAWGIPLGNSGDPSSGHTGAHVYGYNLNGSYSNSMPEHSLTSASINCSQIQDVEVRFMRWLGVESATYDHAYFRLSVDGTNWVTIWSHTGSTLTETSWSSQTYDVSSYADGQSTVYLRWTMGTTDSSLTYCGWNLDDIEIWGSTYNPGPTATPQPPTPTRTPTSPPTVTPTQTPPPATSTPTWTPSPTEPPETASPTSTRTPTPVPDSPTPTPTSTVTPTISPTITPTIHPTTTPPPPTATATPPAPNTPTTTPTAIPPTGLYLFLEDDQLVTGDHFYLYFELCNAGQENMDAQTYILLAIGGDYWCWPSWVNIFENLDSQLYQVPAGAVYREDVLEFEWPAGVGNISGMFIGAVFEPGTWNLIGEVQAIAWECH